MGYPEQQSPGVQRGKRRAGGARDAGGAWGWQSWGASTHDPVPAQRLPHKIRKLHSALERMLVSAAPSCPVCPSCSVSPFLSCVPLRVPCLPSHLISPSCPISRFSPHVPFPPCVPFLPHITLHTLYLPSLSVSPAHSMSPSCPMSPFPVSPCHPMSPSHLVSPFLEGLGEQRAGWGEFCDTGSPQFAEAPKSYKVPGVPLCPLPALR